MARGFASASSEYLNAGSSPITAFGFTTACWFKTSDTTNGQTLINLQDVSAANSGFARLAYQGNATGDPLRAHYSTGVGDNYADKTGYSSGTWAHAAGVFIATATDVKVYIDRSTSPFIAQ